MDDFKPHDLRRTAATNLDGPRGCFFQRFVIARVLGHVDRSGDGCVRQVRIPQREAGLRSTRGIDSSRDRFSRASRRPTPWCRSRGARDAKHIDVTQQAVYGR